MRGARREQYSTKYMPVTLATDGNAPLAGAVAWSESPDQHPCPPLQKARSCSGLHPADMERRGLAAWMPSARRPIAPPAQPEGRPIAASHDPGESPKSALELEMRQMLRSSEAVLEGGARAQTCMCMLHVCTACERRRGAACVHCVLHGLSMRVSYTLHCICTRRAHQDGPAQRAQEVQGPRGAALVHGGGACVYMCTRSCAHVSMLAHMHVHAHGHM